MIFSESKLPTSELENFSKIKTVFNHKLHSLHFPVFLELETLSEI